MGKPVVLAVDIGTSSVRAALYSPDGEASCLVQLHHGVLRPAPFMEEQNPDDVRNLVFRAIADCVEKSGEARANVRGLVFSSQMYSVFPVDSANRPLHNSVLWSDGRAAAEANELRARGLAEELYRATGCPVNSLYPLAKILWFRKNRPELYKGAARFVSIKDYVLYPLLEEWVTDHAMASGTGMFAIARGEWAEPALKATGLPVEKLPSLTPGTQAVPVRNRARLREWGLPESTPVFLGGGDGPLANIGSGASECGGVNIDLGTSGALRVTVDSPLGDPDGSLWCYAMFPGRWAYGGIVANVGNAMQWLGTNIAFSRETLSPDEAAAEIGAMAGTVSPGADGVFCLPYFRKARSPYWDDRLRGTLFGLTAGHDIRHIARAALEAVAFDLASILDIAASRFPVKPPIILTGGLSRNRIMPQLLADVLAVNVRTPTHCEGSLAGAAILGLHGAGLIDGYSFARAVPTPGAVYLPQAEEAGFYKSLRARYAELVEAARNLPLSAGERQ